MAPSATTITTMATPVSAAAAAAAAAKDEKAIVKREKTALEAISWGEVMPGIPTFPSFVAERKHTLTHMAAIFRSWARHGYGDEGMAGHISVRDPEFPGCMWMNPLGRHFGMLAVGDFVLLDIATGAVVAGRPNPMTGKRTTNAAGYYIHSEIHKARGNIHAICHAHSHAGRAWSVFAKQLDMLTQDVCNFYNALAVYGNYGGIVFGAEEGRNIAAALGARNRGAILMNHGLLTVGSTVDEASFLFGLLDRSCAVQLSVEAAVAAAAGGGKRLEKNVISDEEAAFNARMAVEPHVLYREAQAEIEFEMERAGGEEVLAGGFEELMATVDPTAAS